MLSQKVEEQLAQRLVDRINELNTSILKKIGTNIQEISKLTPTAVYQLGQMIKYGATYNEIAKELAKITGLNIQDIYEIFSQVADTDKYFARHFYKYRNLDFIPYKYDIPLQNQVNALATITADQFYNFSNTSIIGYVFKDTEGKNIFKDIQQTYYDVVDKAILSIAQGKTDFYSEMRKTLKQLGGSGLVVYDSGHTRRLDSAVRMNVLDGLQDLHNELTMRFGEEYGADGVEISVHENPAVDHEDIQGKQFSLEEFDKLEAGGIAKDVNGNEYNGAEKRAIGEMNCRHRVINIIIGVTNPDYSEKELKEIQERNDKGFEFEGKHYTMYDGTQLQRRIETEIRKAKDTQILARASGDKELIDESQTKITHLTNKYNDLCKISGLEPQKKRMSVSGFRRVKA